MASSELDSHDHRVPALPSSFLYIPNFLTAEEESELVEKIQAGKWVQLSHRRLQVLPSQLTAKNVLLSDKALPDWLKQRLEPKFAQLGVFAESPHQGMNHVLINEYQPGQGIMPHEDGDAYAPITATVSLGSHTVLNIYEKGEGAPKTPSYRILQEGRSLLVTRGGAYSQLLHGIEEIHTDTRLAPRQVVNWSQLGNPDMFESGSAPRGLRLSLTCRDVLKVSSLGQRLLGRK